MSEILAPAGSPEVLAAALAAGADAVYFGLKKLNARRGAVNFEPVTLESTVTQIHSAGAKAYLTLNIMLCQRELGLAYRTLQCAQNAGVDAVLITDPALLDVIPFFPKLDFHFSTQAAISSSAGVNAAKALGIKRIVLARELSHDEIASCADCGVEIEIFIQGAHCFSCSGRCLLSSWGGGRSGNRGACTSPCRVRWTNDHDVAANPLSMHDMSLLQDLRELEALHLASYKIEGRLKNAKWVSSAVKLAQEALEPDMNLLELQEKAQVLGDYTGRRLSDDFYHGQRHGLTGDSARRALGQLSADCAQNQVETDVAPHLIVTVTPDERNGLHVSLSHGDATDSLRIPPQRIANPKRAVTLSDIFSELPNAIPSNEPTPEFVIPKELSDILLPKSIRNNIHEFISTFLRLKDRDTDGVVRNISLPEQVLELLEKQPFTCPDNSLMLGQRHTHVRIKASQLTKAIDAIAEPLIVNVNPQTLDEAEDLAQAIRKHQQKIHSVALPEVVYESQLEPLRHLLSLLTGTQVVIEINSWDTWQLAREASMPMEAGPGMAVLNASAAETLYRLGCKCVSASQEIDQEQLQDLCATATTPLAITIYSYPKLMITRALLPDGFRPEDHARFHDSRNLTLVPETDGTVTNLRPNIPMDWRNLRNPKIHAARLIADLSACNDLSLPKTDKPFLFNYDRRLR